MQTSRVAGLFSNNVALFTNILVQRALPPCSLLNFHNVSHLSTLTSRRVETGVDPGVELGTNLYPKMFRKQELIPNKPRHIIFQSLPVRAMRYGDKGGAVYAVDVTMDSTYVVTANADGSLPAGRPIEMDQR